MENALREPEGLAMFVKCWNILESVQPKLLVNVGLQILDRVVDFIREYSPNIPTLKIVKMILQHNQESYSFYYSFLLQYCNSISHSIHDETFEVFDLLVERVTFDNRLIEVSV